MGHELGWGGFERGSTADHTAFQRDYDLRHGGPSGAPPPAQPLGSIGFFFFALVSSAALIALGVFVGGSVARQILPEIRSFYAFFPAAWIEPAAGAEGWARATGYLVITWVLAVLAIVLLTLCLNVVARIPLPRWLMILPFFALSVVRAGALCAAIILTALASSIVDGTPIVLPEVGWPSWLIVLAVLAAPVWIGAITLRWGVIPPRRHTDDDESPE